MPSLKFTPADYADLDKLISEIRDRIKQIQSGVGASTSQSSETWHDNSLHEELMHKYSLEQGNLDRYLAIKQQAVIVEPKLGSKLAGIGSTVSFTSLDNDEHRTISIGSYLNIKNTENRISYDSPLGRLLLDKRVNDIVTGQVGGRKVKYQINSVVTE